MKILADFHHGDLFYSLQLLFEKRLGYELYRPVGLEWYHQKYWNVFDHPDTAQQYLGLNIGDEFEKIRERYPGCQFVWLNEGAKEVDPGVYVIYDPTKHCVQRGITLEEFKNTKFDIIVSSIPQHIQPFNKLIQLYQPQAKHVFQVGNAWGHLPGVKNLLASCAPFSVPSDINACFYHQEFDLDVYKSADTVDYPKRVRSYVHFMQNKNQMLEVAKLLPDWDFGCCGASVEEHPLDKGSIAQTAEIAETMKHSGFTWHFKPEGDGFGHSLHGAYATGSIPIVWPSQYRGKLASELMKPNTCVCAEGKTASQLADELRRIQADPDVFHGLRDNAWKRFNEVVDFNKEELVIRNFLNNLK